MDINENEYKKSIDSLCENNITLTADDILKAYENGKRGRGAEVTNLTSSPRKSHLITRYISIAAACVLTIGIAGVVAGAAGHGPLASLFAGKASVETEDPELMHDDTISAELASQGFLLEVGQTQSVDGFDVTFEGVTGDWTDAQMLFTIRVDDTEFAQAHPRLYMTVYRGFGEEAYARRVDTAESFDDEFYENIADYMLFDSAVAYRSQEDPTVYILTYGAYENYVAPGATIVTEIRSIRESGSALIEPEDEEIMLHCVYRITLPEDIAALAPAYDVSYAYDEAPVFTADNGVEYHVTQITFSEYETELLCEFYYEGTELEYVDENFWANYDAAGSAHQEVSQGLRLVVDGVEYEPSDLGGVYAEPSGLRRGMTTFPEADYDGASSVAIVYNGTEIVIR